jgi:hypothetical protein
MAFFITHYYDAHDGEQAEPAPWRGPLLSVTWHGRELAFFKSIKTQLLVVGVIAFTLYLLVQNLENRTSASTVTSRPPMPERLWY